MKSDLFMHEVRQTSSVFGRKHDVNVVFHGAAAMTDGDTIILPEIKRDAEISETAAQVMRGYTDHEAGHLRHSDMALIRRRYTSLAKEGKHLTKAVHNALEDVWLETKVRAEYPGSETNLRATASAVNEMLLARVREGSVTAEELADPNFVTAIAITWAGRKGYGGPSCEACLDLLSPELRANVERWAAEAAASSGTAQNFKIAERIADEIAREEAEEKDAPKPDKPRPEGGRERKGKGESEGEGKRKSETKPEAEGEGEGEGEGKSGPAPEAGPEAETKPEGEATAGGESAPESGEAPSVRAPYSDFDAKHALEHTLRDEKLSGAEACGGGGYMVFSTMADKWWHRSMPETSKDGLAERMLHGSAQQYDKRLASMQGEVNAIRRKLERALMAKQRRDWEFGREDGRLDARRFAAAMAGRTSVFKAKTDRVEIDTALTLLVDLSGSMNGTVKGMSGPRQSKVAIASDCVLAIAEAVDRTGVAYEVIGFSNRKELPAGWRRQIGEAKGAGMSFARYEPLDMYIFKSFEERLFEAKGPIYSIRHCAGGENSDGEAVMQAYMRLRQRPERRKVLMTLSDGSPACVCDDWAALRRHLRTTIEMIRREGASCLGVGIADDSVREFYPEYVVVNRLEELAGEALGLLSKQLLGERVNIDRSVLLAAS